MIREVEMECEMEQVSNPPLLLHKPFILGKNNTLQLQIRLPFYVLNS